MTDDAAKPVPAAAPALDKRLARIGWGLTGAWIVFLTIWVIPRLDHLFALELNAFGDFLAGTFAPLAFLWLVLGFFQQGAELRNSVEALQLQGHELRNSVVQQEELVKTARDQLKFENDRIAADRALQRQLAQPEWELMPAGTMQTGTNISLEFVLSNHGHPCTNVRVYFHGRRPDLRFDSVGPTTPRGFVVEADTEIAEKFRVTIAFIDGQYQKGQLTFVVQGNFPSTTIWTETSTSAGS